MTPLKIGTTLVVIAAIVTIAFVALRSPTVASRLLDHHALPLGVDGLTSSPDSGDTSTSVERSEQQRGPSDTNSGEVTEAWVHDNIELSKAHYEFSDDGIVVLPIDREMEFEKIFRFQNGEQVTIQYRLIDPLDSSTLLTDIDISFRKFGPIVEKIRNGNMRVASSAAKHVAFCEELAASRQPQRFADNCDGFNPAMRLEIEQAIGAQASKGDPWAMSYQASLLADGGRKDAARDVYNDLWSRGYIAGLSGLIQTGGDISYLEYDKQIEQLSYLYASYVITAAYLDGVPSSAIVVRRDLIKDRIESQLNQLSYPVSIDVERAAQKMLAGTSACCQLFTGIQ